MATVVEVGFDLTSTGGPFLSLDDPIAGQLDNSNWVLAGYLFVDISNYVNDVSIRRGRNRQLDRFGAGGASITLNNENRTFDPTYTASPYYGNIVPRREIRISTDGIRQFTGVIDDWNLNYSTSFRSEAEAVASDGFTILAGQVITPGTAIAQSSGSRINAILSDPKVDWPLSRRNIDTGVANLGNDVIQPNTNALSYLQLVETSEQGSFFIAKNGDATFLDRTVGPASSGVVTFADDGTGVPFIASSVQYGTEYLYNQVQLSSVITGATAIAEDLDSQVAYGISNLTIDGLLVDTNAQLENTAVFLAQLYSQPDYRFDGIEVILDSLTTAQKTDILNIEIGSVCKIIFTPNNIPPSIVKYAEVISISHKINPDSHKISFGFSTLDFTYLVLDDAQFGKLNSGNALSY